MALMNWGTVSLLLIAAFGYSIATMGMKIGSTGLTFLAIALMAIGFLAAAASEIVILRTADLGIVYITIIGIETLIVLSYAAMIGEGLDLRQMTGAGLVMAGIAIVSH